LIGSGNIRRNKVYKLDENIKMSRQYFGAYLLIGQRIFTVNDANWRILDCMSRTGKSARELSQDVGLPYAKVIQCLNRLVDIGVVRHEN